MRWTKRHAAALQAVFAAFNDAGLQWLVLRNHEGLPQQNRSKDIDLVVSKHSFPKASAILAQTLKAHNFTHCHRQTFQYVRCFTFFDNSQSPVISMKIDLLDGFVWRGAQLVSFSELYARRVARTDFEIPDPVADGFMLWCKPLMTGGFIKEKYRADILAILKISPHGFRTLLQKTFGGRMAKAVWPMLAQGKLEDTVPLRKKLCRAAWLVALRNQPMQTISATLEHGYREIIRRSKRPKASILAVLGPDGAGKSTVIDLLQHELARIMVKDTDDIRILHFRPNLFPNIKAMLGGKRYDATQEEFTAPHRAQPAGRISSVLRLIYYWLDYLVGYWLRIRTGCLAGKIYIFDRYFYDFIVDPYRSRIKLPDWLRLLFLQITPEPDIVFILCCDPDTIYARKQELTPMEITRQSREYLKLARRSKRLVTLDAANPPEQLCNDALRQVIQQSFPDI